MRQGPLLAVFLFLTLVFVAAAQIGQRAEDADDHGPHSTSSSGSSADSDAESLPAPDLDESEEEKPNPSPIPAGQPPSPMTSNGPFGPSGDIETSPAMLPEPPSQSSNPSDLQLADFDPNNPSHVITQAMRLLHRREHAAMDNRHQWEHHQLASKHAQELSTVQAQLEAESAYGGAPLPMPAGVAGPLPFPQFPPHHPYNQIHPSAFLQNQLSANGGDGQPLYVNGVAYPPGSPPSPFSPQSMGSNAPPPSQPQPLFVHGQAYPPPAGMPPFNGPAQPAAPEQQPGAPRVDLDVQAQASARALAQAAPSAAAPGAPKSKSGQQSASASEPNSSESEK